MVRKRMSNAVKKAVTDNALALKGGERLTDSITGSLRIEGYNVKREDVEKAVTERQTNE